MSRLFSSFELQRGEKDDDQNQQGRDVAQHRVALGRLPQEFDISALRCTALQFTTVKGEAGNVYKDQQAAEVFLEQEPEGQVRSAGMMLAQQIQSRSQNDDGAGDQRAHVHTVYGLKGLQQHFSLRRFGGSTEPDGQNMQRTEPGGDSGDVKKESDVV